MEKFANLVSTVSGAFDFNQATLSGAIDIVMIQAEDGSRTSTCFHVRFGKLQLLHCREKLVDVLINGQKVQGLAMKLGPAGEAFFVEEMEVEAGKVEADWLTSPLVRPKSLDRPHSMPDLNLQTSSSSSLAASSLSSLLAATTFKAAKTPLPLGEDETGEQGDPATPVDDQAEESGAGVALLAKQGAAVQHTDAGVGEDAADEGDSQEGDGGGHRVNGLHEDGVQPGGSDEVHEMNGSHGTRQDDHGSLYRRSSESHSDSELIRTAGISHRGSSTRDLPFPEMAPTSPRSEVEGEGGDQGQARSWKWGWGGLPVRTKGRGPRTSRVRHQSESQWLREPDTPDGYLSEPALIGSRSRRSLNLDHSPDSDNDDTDDDDDGNRRELEDVAEGGDDEGDQEGDVQEENEDGGEGRGSEDTLVEHDKATTGSNGVGSSHKTDFPRRSLGKVAKRRKGKKKRGSRKKSRRGVRKKRGKEGETGEGEGKDELGKLKTRRSSGRSCRSNRRRRSSGLEADDARPFVDGTQSTERLGRTWLRSIFRSMIWRSEANTLASTPSFSVLPPQEGDELAVQDQFEKAWSVTPDIAAAYGDETADKYSPDSSRRNSESCNERDRGSALKPSKSSMFLSQLISSVVTDPADVPVPSSDDDSVAGSRRESGEPQPSDLQMSLCRSLLNVKGSSRRQRIAHNTRVFAEHAVSYSQLCQHPGIVFEPDLVLRYQDKLYPSRVALPLLLSQLAFNRPLTLSDEALSSLLPDMASSALSPLSTQSSPSQPTPPSTFSPATSPSLTSPARSPATSKPSAGIAASRLFCASRRNSYSPRDSSPLPPLDIEEGSGVAEAGGAEKSVDAVIGEPTSARRGWMDWLRPGSPGTAERHDSLRSSDTSLTEEDVPMALPPLAMKAFRKSLRPSPQQLRALPLKWGKNTICFSVTSSLQGVQEVSASVYVWRPDAKIVISDVDGTITRSDVLGNVLPLVGGDWSHLGVTDLFTAIANNGYNVLYLTSRAIGQARITRRYIKSLRQGSSALPEGPVIMSPDRLMPSFKREVIDRKPQEFKIVALRDVRHLFPDSYSPFHAGFGNRPTDTISYRAVGVQLSKIFIINPNGQVGNYNNSFQSSYPEIVARADYMFPPLKTGKRTKVESDYNDFKFWTTDMVVDDQELPELD